MMRPGRTKWQAPPVAHSRSPELLTNLHIPPFTDSTPITSMILKGQSQLSISLELR